MIGKLIDASSVAHRAAELKANSLRSVLAERERQDALWGEQNHEPLIYLGILTEEVGEFAQCALHRKFGGKHGTDERLREEAIHCAAVALAIVECLDRGKWKEGQEGKA
jgi:NTP pyrophosphatase (non-canonical NTP hydrolase)